MKKIFNVMILLILFGCNKDLGNYEYKSIAEVEPLVVNGIEGKYTVITPSTFILKPILKNVNDGDYEYCWYIYSTSSGVQRDTIGLEKNLNWFVKQISGDYKLVFQIKNKKSQICTYIKSDIVITSSFSTGWYVTKDENKITDIDWVNSDGEVIPNVLAMINGKGIPGSARKTTYMNGSYIYEKPNEDGTITKINNLKVIFTMSDMDMNVYNADNLELLRDFNSIFVAPPSKREPQDIIHGAFLGSFIINSGKVHSLSTITSPSSGRFGYSKMGEQIVSEYIYRTPMDGILLFDKSTSSFVRASIGGGNSIGNIIFDNSQDLVDPNNMNCDLVFMKERSINAYFSIEGFGILQNKTTAERSAFIIDPSSWQAGKNPIKTYFKIGQDKDIQRGKVFGVNNYNNTLYFSEGDNLLKSFNMINQDENKELFKFSNNETVGFINHIIYEDNTTPTASKDCLVVLTNSPDGWRLYAFKFIGQTADIEKTEYEFYQGKGYAGQAIYRGVNSNQIN